MMVIYLYRYVAKIQKIAQSFSNDEEKMTQITVVLNKELSHVLENNFSSLCSLAQWRNM